MQYKKKRPKSPIGLIILCCIMYNILILHLLLDYRIELTSIKNQILLLKFFLIQSFYRIFEGFYEFSIDFLSNTILKYE